jgi:hypothetical protein
MPIGALFEAEGFTQDDYDAVLALVGEEPPEGCLVHIAGPTPSGWRVIEVWTSEDVQKRFQEGRLDPAFDKAGTRRVNPTYFEVHMVLPPEEALASLAGGG